MDKYNNERQGVFTFTQEELEHKSIMQAISEKCLEIIGHDLQNHEQKNRLTH
jgi:hypothetical protein